MFTKIERHEFFQNSLVAKLFTLFLHQTFNHQNMPAEYKMIIINAIALIVLVIVLFKIKDWVNKTAENITKKGGKKARSIAHKRYAKRVNKEEAKIFGKNHSKSKH